MGGVISALQDTITDADNKVAEMVKENLRQCQASAEIIAKSFRSQVLEVYKNPEEFGKWQVSGGRQDREDSFIGVSTKSTPASDIKEGVESLVNGIFGAIQGKESADSFQSAVSRMISGAFNAFLGNASAGSSTHSKFLIIPHGLAFHRVDIYMYKYTFSSQGFKDHYESQTVVYASRGILDIENLKRSELLSYVSDIIGDDIAKIKQWMKDFMEMYKLAKEMLKDEDSQYKKSAMPEFSFEMDGADLQSSAIPEVFYLPGPKALQTLI